MTHNNPLDKWMIDNGVTNTAAAEMLRAHGYNLSVERVRQLRFPFTDERYSAPYWPTMQAIYLMTGGKIAPNDWADPTKFPGIKPKPRREKHGTN
jgi:hypothetical protein